jgi:hypothetical protein
MTMPSRANRRTGGGIRLSVPMGTVAVLHGVSRSNREALLGLGLLERPGSVCV